MAKVAVDGKLNGYSLFAKNIGGWHHLEGCRVSSVGCPEDKKGGYCVKAGFRDFEGSGMRKAESGNRKAEVQFWDCGILRPWDEVTADHLPAERKEYSESSLRLSSRNAGISNRGRAPELGVGYWLLAIGYWPN